MSGHAKGKNPASHAHVPWDRHLQEQVVDDVEWLCSPDGGSLLLADACRRVGKTPEAVAKAFERRGKTAPK